MTTRASTRSLLSFDGVVTLVGKLKQRFNTAAGRGALWTMLGFGTGQVLRLVSSLILTRLLFPEAFGLVALASVFVTGLEMLSDAGIRQWLIRHPRAEAPEVLDTAWTVQVVRGVILFGCACAVAVPIARSYDQPELAPLICGLAVSALIMAFNSLAFPLASRRMEFGAVTLVQLTTSLIGIIAMSLAATKFATPWVLVGGNILSATLQMFAGHVFLDSPRPRRFRVDRNALKELLSFGKWIFISSMTFFLASQGDRMLLGHYLPLSVLASYMIADQLSRLPRMVVDSLANNVGFPLFARANQADPKTLPDVLARMQMWLDLFQAGAAFLFVIAIPLVGFMYDARYSDAGWILQLLCLRTIIACTTRAASSCLVAMGHPHYNAIEQVLNAVGLVVGIVIGSALGGVRGAVLGIALSELLSFAMLQFALIKHRLFRFKSLCLTACWVVAGALGGFAAIEVLARIQN